jgi:hypothetical protein
MTAQTIKPINKRAAAMSPIKCQSVRAPRNPIVLRDSAISSSDIHATTRSPRFSRHRVPWAIVPSHARWPWPSARRISRPSRAAFYAQRHRPHQRASTRSVLTHSLTPPVTRPLTSWHKPQTNHHQEHHCRRLGHIRRRGKPHLRVVLDAALDNRQATSSSASSHCLPFPFHHLGIP